MVFLSCEYYRLKTGVPTVVSFPRAQRKIVEFLKKETENQIYQMPYHVLDLGSGGGQLCRRIAKTLPAIKVTGIEISFLPWLRSILTQRLMGPPNLAFKRLDFWTYDCRSMNAIVVFLTGKEILERVGQKLRKELKPGTLIIANDEKLGADWVPLETVENAIHGIFHSKIYIYRQG